MSKNVIDPYCAVNSDPSVIDDPLSLIFPDRIEFIESTSNMSISVSLAVISFELLSKLVI